MTALTAPHFHDDDAARRYLEAIRWPAGPVCPHCGSYGPHYALKGKGGEKGTQARAGLWKCREKGCRKQFSVTVGTVFERSHIPLSKWLAAAYLLCSSKKGISAHQLHRTLGVTYKTAWFLAHRIRHAMETPAGMFGSGGGIVEADETYIGKKAGAEVKVGWGHKQKVFALVERGGKARSFRVHGKMFDTVKDVLSNNVAADAHLMTDEARLYNSIGKRFATHNTVNHSDGEYGRGIVHTNTIEGYFSVFKRGMKGVYQHCGEKHLHRYLSEFDFRYNHRSALGVEDAQRVVDALSGIEGKRLTYR
jgi:transposase-like protein